MAMVRYLFGNMATNEIIAELPLQSVSMDRQLNDYGVFRGTTYLDQTDVSNQDIIEATLPGRTFVVCELDNVPVWDGIVWTRTYDSQGKDLNLTARTYEGYFEKNLIATSFGRTATEQRQIVADLINNLQADPNRNLGLVVPSGFDTTVLRDLSVLSTDFKNYLEVISGITDGVDGFDWTIDTQHDPVTGEYLRTVRFGYPTLGALDSGNLTFDYPGQVTNYWQTDGMTNAATDFFLLGAGEGSDMLVGAAEQTDMLTGGHKRYDAVVSRKDITDQASLNSMATQLGKQRRPPYTTIKFNTKGDLDPVFGSYGLGDNCSISIVDPRHPDGFTRIARVIAWVFRPASDDSTAEAELVFEGDDLND